MHIVKRYPFSVLSLIILGILPFYAEAKDCQNAKSLDECAEVCADVYPPEMDYGGGPYAPFIKRYNDCLKKAFKTYRLPQFWFSSYPQSDRYRSMFLTNVLDPVASLSKFSSCEGKNIAMPVVMEIWESGMIAQYIAITNKNWVYLSIASSGVSEGAWINIGTLSGNQTKFYRNVIMSAHDVYISPMNNYERPKLETASLKNGLFLGFYDEDVDTELDYILPVPSETANVLSPFGQVLWSGFDQKRTSWGDDPGSLGNDPYSFKFYRPEEIQFMPSRRSMNLKSVARYEYNDNGLPKSVSVYQINSNTNSFEEISTVSVEFDETGRLVSLNNPCDDNDNSCSISFVYNGDGNCPVQINHNGEASFKIEYNRDGRLVRRYSVKEPSKHDIRLYYKNDMDYAWNIDSLKFTYDKPLRTKPNSSRFEPDEKSMFRTILIDPNDKLGLEDHFARPFLMDLDLVSQDDFEKMLRRTHLNRSISPDMTKQHECVSKQTEPAVSVTWFDALAYANARSKSEGFEECYRLDRCEFIEGWYVCRSAKFKGLDCRGYRLPTWEEAKLTSDISSKSHKYEWIWDWYGPSDKYCWGGCAEDREESDNKNQHNSLGPDAGVCRRVTGKSSFPEYNPIACYPPGRGGELLGFRLVRTAM